MYAKTVAKSLQEFARLFFLAFLHIINCLICNCLRIFCNFVASLNKNDMAWYDLQSVEVSSEDSKIVKDSVRFDKFILRNKIVILELRKRLNR